MYKSEAKNTLAYLNGYAVAFTVTAYPYLCLCEFIAEADKRFFKKGCKPNDF